MNSFYDSLPIFLQNAACTVGGFQRSRERYTRHFHTTLEEWERRFSDPEERHVALQWDRLQVLLDRARAHHPFYRDLPDAIHDPDPQVALRKTLERIPIIDKAIYRERSNDFLPDDVSRSSLVEVSTSGTTGSAIRVWHTPERIAEGYAAVWRQRHRFLVNLDDPHMTFGGRVIVPLAQQKPPFWRTNHYWGQTLFSIFHLAPENLESYVEQIHATDATYVQGYPSALHLVGRALAEVRPLQKGRLRAVFTSSESLLPYQRESIEAGFGAPVRDHYAATELCASMTACRFDRLHTDTEFCVVEVEPLEETDEYVRGPLLVTGLGSVGTPFIRYRIGDIGTRSKRPCECGRAGDVFLDVDGRTEDYVSTPEGRVVGRLDHIFKEAYDIVEAQIVQEVSTAVEVRVVPDQGFDAGSRRRLIRQVRSRLGADIDVDVTLVDQLPREPNGKFRAVKSRVGGLAP